MPSLIAGWTLPTAAARRESSRNRFLESLPEQVLRRILRRTELVEMKAGDTVNEPGSQLHYALFPETNVISVVSLMAEGRTIEVATIGREGMSGAAALLGVDRVPFRYLVQIPGSALRIRVRDLLEFARPGSELSLQLVRYYVAFTSQIMQSVACAGLHSVEQRCCRWLLATHDRVDSDSFPMTHERLALMLGTRRTSVSEVLKRLRDRGLIAYHRGMITVVDRRTLQRHSCECYHTVARTFARIIGRSNG